MGALHPGHISLIHTALEQADIVVCSVFVNPTQFTDPNDLARYPRPVAHDVAMLTEAGCDAVFMPSVQEMYPTWPQPEPWQIDLGPAEFLLEGAFRKGHYQGVTQIVKKLFDAVEPDIALFGQKDYQQVLMIRNMVDRLHLSVEIISCPIIRESDGLAMSSRNVHLSADDRQHAKVLSRALQYIKDHSQTRNVVELLENAGKIITDTPDVQLDYLTVANRETLQPVLAGSASGTIALVAATVGTTRLIDNMLI